MRSVAYSASTIHNLLAEPQEADGPFLSLYVPRDAHWRLTRLRIQRQLDLAKTLLAKNMSLRAAKQRVELIAHWVHSSLETLEPSEGLAIFQNNGLETRVVRVSAQVPEICVVASSYHVEPLMKLSYLSPSYLMVVASARQFTVFERTQSYLRQVYRAIPSNSAKPNSVRVRVSEVQDFVKDSMRDFASTTQSLRYDDIAVLGPEGLRKELVPVIEGLNMRVVAELELPRQPSEIVAEIDRQFAIRKLKDTSELSPMVKNAITAGAFRTSLAEISKAVHLGKVDSLLLSGDHMLWGKPSHEGFQMTGSQRDASDDCLLDDLAESVLIRGGRVYFVDADVAPFCGPAAAILK